MSTLERAIALAALAHQGQTDKGGAPYIEHPLRIMLKMKTPEQKMAAVLHDVMEDGHVTAATLTEQGFSSTVIAAVSALTRRSVGGKIEPYEDYVRRAAANPIARVVKLADLEDNMDLTRIPHPTPKDYKRVERYRAAKKIIEAAINQQLDRGGMER